MVQRGGLDGDSRCDRIPLADKCGDERISETYIRHGVYEASHATATSWTFGRRCEEQHDALLQVAQMDVNLGLRCMR